MRRREMDQSRVARRELKHQLKAREEQKFMMRARLAKRDIDYAESGCAAPVTVEVRDLRNSELGQILRIETRGNLCIGAYAVNHSTNS